MRVRELAENYCFYFFYFYAASLSNSPHDRFGFFDVYLFIFRPAGARARLITRGRPRNWFRPQTEYLCLVIMYLPRVRRDFSRKRRNRILSIGTRFGTEPDLGGGGG